MKLVPKYFVDKFRGTDQEQIKSLPEKIRKDLLFGSVEEFRNAIEGVRARERNLGKTLLDQAAMEHIYDIRAANVGVGKERKG